MRFTLCPLESECALSREVGAINCFAAGHYARCIPLECFLGGAGCADRPSHHISNKLVNCVTPQLEG